MQPMNEALIVIDVQNDFCPGGALAVADGDAIVPQINALIGDFGTVVLTQDWHPANHSSFAANHPGAAAYSLVEMPYGPQVLWPVHCVQGTAGADFHAGLRTDAGQMIIRKGFRRVLNPLAHALGLFSHVVLPLYSGALSVLMTPEAFIQSPSRWMKAEATPNTCVVSCQAPVLPALRAASATRTAPRPASHAPKRIV